MGLGGTSIGSLLLILLIVIVIFGTKKLRNIGSDLGGAIKNFRSAMREESDKPEEPAKLEHEEQDAVFKDEVSSKHKDKV